MPEALRTRARFPEVDAKAGHYESFYLKASDPAAPRAVWIRYTVHKRPGEAPKASLWFTLFGPEGPRAVKATTAELTAPPDAYIQIGDALFGPGNVKGSAEAGGGAPASWELSFDTGDEVLLHLPRNRMYTAPVPRTKLLSPHPNARFSGRVEVGGEAIELRDWPGMVGHNWGAEHAERWIWMHGASFDYPGGAWLDVAIGRIKLGPWTIPWIANGVVCVDGIRQRVGGIERVRATEVDESPTGCEFVLPGKGVKVRGRVSAPRERFVGWVYADPDGSEHNTVNCSIASMELQIERDHVEPLRLRTDHGAAYELGMRETDHGMEIQPFPDG
jgi:hypothetical protein